MSTLLRSMATLRHTACRMEARSSGAGSGTARTYMHVCGGRGVKHIMVMHPIRRLPVIHSAIHTHRRGACPGGRGAAWRRRSAPAGWWRRSQTHSAGPVARDRCFVRNHTRQPTNERIIYGSSNIPMPINSKPTKQARTHLEAVHLCQQLVHDALAHAAPAVPAYVCPCRWMISFVCV